MERFFPPFSLGLRACVLPSTWTVAGLFLPVLSNILRISISWLLLLFVQFCMLLLSKCKVLEVVRESINVQRIVLNL